MYVLVAYRVAEFPFDLDEPLRLRPPIHGLNGFEIVSQFPNIVNMIQGRAYFLCHLTLNVDAWLEQQFSQVWPQSNSLQIKVKFDIQSLKESYVGVFYNFILFSIGCQLLYF